MEFCVLFCVALTLTNQLAFCQEPVGCGGFLRPPHKISYRQVRIKLYYPDGSLRSTTDVSPNGAYTIPIYDYGDYVIKVDPPEGWTFEPVEGYSIAVKGRDSCSKDFNFQFAGFPLQGKMLTKGLNSGPSGIMIRLEEESTKKLVTAPVMTTEGGKFEFLKIMPGNYRIQAEHSSVQFAVQEVLVKMSADGTTHMEKVLMTRGTSVSFGVTSDQLPIKGVMFFVYPLDNQELLLNSEIPTGCLTDAVVEFSNSYPSAPFCHVISDVKGQVSLGPLPGGRYMLVPYYRGESNLVFDVQPNSHIVNVAHEALKLGSHAFQVVGYAVSGRVVVAQGGAGVSGARVLMENKSEVITDAEGRFTIEGMRSGSFMILVSAENMEFEPRRVQVSASASRLADVIADRFSVCGQVVIDKVGSGSVSDERQIVVESAKDQRQLMSVTARGEHGSFCAFLAPGSYLLRALVSQKEDELGLRLAPVRHEVHVSTAPVSGLHFSQFRALISGSVDCLDTCPILRLSLTSTNGAAGDSKTLELSMQQHVASHQWQFVDVMPGRYSLRLEEIAESRNCWQDTEKSLEVLDKDLEQIVFLQNGYRLIVASSHSAQFFYAHEASDMFKGQQSLHKGAQSICLPSSGNYTLSATSCHKLEQSQWRYDTALSSSSVDGPLSVVASQHQITLVLELDNAVDDLRLKIEYEGNAQLNHVLGPLNMEPGSLKVTVSLWESINTVLRVTPMSQLALFEPSISTVAVSGVECNPTVAVLRGQLGAFVVGQVHPPLAEVEITLLGVASESTTTSTTLTNSLGQYRFGPLPRTAQYTVSARKLGYKFSSVESTTNDSETTTTVALEQRRDFKLYKLAEVLVDVRDIAGKPLSGVLLSVSGDDYRGNELTDAEGRYRFLGLTPGIYYVRAAMKEYQFTLDNAGEVNVEEGRTVTLQGRGQQVAFTASGIVLSLNGEAEPNLVMEAVSEATSDSNEASCTPGHVESGSTDLLGHFRLRGLQPGCRYSIQLRSEAPTNLIIERTSPSQLHIVMSKGDLPALQFYAFRRLQLLHLSASVDTPLKDHVATLRLQIFPENAPHRVLLTHHLSKSPLLYTSDLPADGKRYVMRLESTLPSSMWSGAGPQEMSFRSLGVEQSGALHLRIQFRPQRRVAEPDVAASSFFILPLTLLLALACYYRKNLLPYKDPIIDYFRLTILNRLFGLSGGSASASSGGTSPRHHSSQFSDPNDLSDISPDLLRPLTIGNQGIVNFGFRGGKSAKAKARKT